MKTILKAALVALAVAAATHSSCKAAEPLQTVEAPQALRAQSLLPPIAAWLSGKYALPTPPDLPAIELVPAARLPALRYRGLVPERWQAVASAESGTEASLERQVIAVYDDARRIIYLRDDWTGSTAAEQSVLVHEMVHHVQNVSRMKYECVGAREKLAYEAQDDWLKLNGSDLEREFAVDMFMIFILSACMHQ